MSGSCNVCPRRCGADRINKRGVCAMPDEPVLARCGLHFWEEPCISGEKGSGAVFFSGCSLKCVFCQNEKISRGNFGRQVTVDRLGEVFDELTAQGAQNINLVNPTHFVPAIVKALRSHPVSVPVIYNTGGYERVETLRELEGLVDVYLPDLKYMDSSVSEKYAAAPDYFEFASEAVKEMSRQVGSPVFDENGMIQKGLIVRHLILPSNTIQSVKILRWFSENLPRDTYLSLMCQYTPCGDLSRFPELQRRITRREYEKVLGVIEELGLTNGYVQELSSAKTEYIPDFSLQGVEKTEEKQGENNE